jgi:hypothetical protein
MTTVFWDAKAVINVDVLEQGGTYKYDAGYYCDLTGLICKIVLLDFVHRLKL